MPLLDRLAADARSGKPNDTAPLLRGLFGPDYARRVSRSANPQPLRVAKTLAPYLAGVIANDGTARTAKDKHPGWWHLTDDGWRPIRATALLDRLVDEVDDLATALGADARAWPYDSAPRGNAEAMASAVERLSGVLASPRNSYAVLAAMRDLDALPMPTEPLHALAREALADILVDSPNATTVYTSDVAAAAERLGMPKRRLYGLVSAVLGVELDHARHRSGWPVSEAQRAALLGATP